MEYNDYELLDLIFENDEVAYKIMLDKYMPIIYTKAVDYYTYLKNNGYGSICFSDFIALGMETFDNAVRKYDLNKGYLFYTFFLVCLKIDYSLFLRTMKSKKNRPIFHYQELDFEICDSSQIDPYLKIETEDLKYKLKDYLYSLDFVDSAILELRINNFKYREIIQLLQVPSSRINRVVIKARNTFSRCL